MKITAVTACLASVLDADGLALGELPVLSARAALGLGAHLLVLAAAVALGLNGAALAGTSLGALAGTSLGAFAGTSLGTLVRTSLSFEVQIKGKNAGVSGLSAR